MLNSEKKVYVQISLANVTASIPPFGCLVRGPGKFCVMNYVNQSVPSHWTVATFLSAMPTVEGLIRELD